MLTPRGTLWIRHVASLAMALASCRSRPHPPSATSHALAEMMASASYRREGAPYALPYRLFVPGAYVAQRQYPLVVYLHGSGGRGDDNLRQLSQDVAELLSNRVQAIEPFFLLAPQCPVGDEWVNRHDRAPFRNYDQSKVPESAVSQMTFDVIDQIQGQYSIDRKRTYVTGYSMGGSGTWDFVTRHPGIFAAAVPVTGVNDPNRSGELTQLAIWAFHGARDDVSPVQNTRAMVERLKQAGSSVRYSELSNVGHDSNRFVYNDLNMYRWLLSQQKP